MATGKPVMMNDIEQCLPGTKTAGLYADEDGGCSGLTDERCCLLYRFTQNVFVFVQPKVRCPRSWLAARLVYEVGRYLYVNGPGIGKAGGQGFIDPALRLNGIRQQDGRLGNVPVERTLQVHVADRVMEKVGVEPTSQAESGSPAEDHDRYPLSKGARNRVVCAEAADPVGDADRTEA